MFQNEVLVWVYTEGTPLLLSINENTKNNEIDRSHWQNIYNFFVYITIKVYSH